ncbi:alanine racemase [Sphingomonas alpina]|uniref:Alanine racemase n=1 Tax=Sphingomonas alpina TaxID=653931 RepID=A0A7H0LMB0_9SPHN|nr:alanine racemase [Sphingomonas alpina]QNQ10813.1 alanine racemase [Sphingomonas alpina]
MTPLATLQTPALLLDVQRVERNAARMRAAVTDRGVLLRTHVKTSKSIDVARLVIDPERPAITVSTLREAEIFFDHGMHDIFYAVGITPNKLDRAFDLRARGAALMLVVDTVDAAHAVASAARRHGDAVPVTIEIDSDGHRAGVRPDQKDVLLAIAAALVEGARVAGVMTHAGGSYNARSDDELRHYARLEREGAITAANHLRQAGYDIDTVSIGSTPTALFAEHFKGITEVRAGVFTFFDLVMAGIGVCGIDEIAISVLSSVIAVQPDKGQIVIDAGWMALSRDRGTAAQPVDQGYGLVCDADGVPIPDLIVAAANQEHGLVRVRDDSPCPLPDLKIGDLIRILPNHACATGAQHDAYQVFDVECRAATAVWPRFHGW